MFLYFDLLIKYINPFIIMFDHIFLTGFKKFGGDPINPTEEIVK